MSVQQCFCFGVLLPELKRQVSVDPCQGFQEIPAIFPFLDGTTGISLPKASKISGPIFRHGPIRRKIGWLILYFIHFVPA